MMRSKATRGAGLLGLLVGIVTVGTGCEMGAELSAVARASATQAVGVLISSVFTSAVGQIIPDTDGS